MIRMTHLWKTQETQFLIKENTKQPPLQQQFPVCFAILLFSHLALVEMSYLLILRISYDKMQTIPPIQLLNTECIINIGGHKSVNR